jgi:hypothetical protein
MLKALSLQGKTMARLTRSMNDRANPQLLLVICSLEEVMAMILLNLHKNSVSYKGRDESLHCADGGMSLV